MENAFEFARKLMIAHYQQDFLDDLLSDDKQVATEAAAEFGDILYHQGDIYKSSLEAVPDLVAALPHASSPVKEQFIYTLGGIATGQNTPDADPSLIPEASKRVLEHWDGIADCMTDQNDRVRLAALITLTDLARIQQMDFRGTPPRYVGALPDGVTAEDLEQRLRQTIDATRDDFDPPWNIHCNVALAYLSFAPLPQIGVHDYWSMLDRDHA